MYYPLVTLRYRNSAKVLQPLHTQFISSHGFFALALLVRLLAETRWIWTSSLAPNTTTRSLSWYITSSLSAGDRCVTRHNHTKFLLGFSYIFNFSHRDHYLICCIFCRRSFTIVQLLSNLPPTLPVTMLLHFSVSLCSHFLQPMKDVLPMSSDAEAQVTHTNTPN